MHLLYKADTVSYALYQQICELCLKPTSTTATRTSLYIAEITWCITALHRSKPPCNKKPLGCHLTPEYLQPHHGNSSPASITTILCNKHCASTQDGQNAASPCATITTMPIHRMHQAVDALNYLFQPEQISSRPRNIQ